MYVLQAAILENKKINKNTYKIRLKAPEIAENSNPGQFVHVRCGSTDDPFLRRPLSINGVEKENVSILFKTAGRGTTLLAERQPGDMLDLMGPLGTGFPLRDNMKKIAVIGGGIGIAPLLYLTQKAKEEKIHADVFIGAPDLDNLLCVDEFEKIDAGKVLCVTEDGSTGFKGLPTKVLEKYLGKNDYDAIYTCGPLQMMKAVKNTGKDYGLPVYVSLEERMACGIGACLGCTCKTSEGNKKVCKDGPVFNAEEVAWDE